MVNPRVIHRERSLCSLNEKDFAPWRIKLPRCGAAPAASSRSRKTQGMKDKIGGSMWVPF
jgi:hypothetical protein